VLAIAAQFQAQAWKVLGELDVVGAWSAIGAEVHLVGSLQTGLLIGHRDIDFHIYTDPFSLSGSFIAMARLAANPGLRAIRYRNLLHAEDRSVDWHAFYHDAQGDEWQVDMIHLCPDSPYVGYFERVAERIAALLTPETREAILAIKYAIPQEERVKAVEVYRAVIEGGVRDEQAFWAWRQDHAQEGIITWMP